eukprot:g60375.t1
MATLATELGNKNTDNSGQLPGVTTRRDSHGATRTVNGKYVHVTDRIQNDVEVFNTETLERSSYDLISASGKGGRTELAGPCYAHSVLDDPNLPLNDPASDLLDRTPDGKYLVVALRGPAPITVNHAAQGSCPGVGIIELSKDGKSGKLVDVLRSTNTVDTVTAFQIPGGVNYAGKERSDVHGVHVVPLLK